MFPSSRIALLDLTLIAALFSSSPLSSLFFFSFFLSCAFPFKSTGCLSNLPSLVISKYTEKYGNTSQSVKDPFKDSNPW